MISRKAPLFALAVCAILVLASAGCGASDKTDSASSSGCAALVVEFDGHTYRSTAAKVAPVSGDPLGRVTVPPCRDTPGAGEEAAEEIELMAIEGVPAARRALLDVAAGAVGLTSCRAAVGARCPQRA